jgi:DNA-binding response OmpR family regulator
MNPSGPLLPPDENPDLGADLDAIAARSERTRVLVVDDDPDMVSLLKVVLRGAGMNVASALSGAEALRKTRRVDPDILLLDLMMPEMDGFETLRRLRKISNVPVVIVSAKHAKEDVVRGLDLGADDYVTKPIYPREIISRVEAVLRRAQPSASRQRVYFPGVELEIEFETREASLHGEAVQLTPKEFAVLSVLARGAPKPVPYDEICDEVWGERGSDARNRLKWLVHQIRGKMGEKGPEQEIIHTRVGFGYQLATEANTQN